GVAEAGDGGVDLMQRDQSSVCVDGAPILAVDEVNEFARGMKVLEFGHQPTHDVGVHAGERFFQLLTVPAVPGAYETRVVSEFLFLLGLPALHGVPRRGFASNAAHVRHGSTTIGPALFRRSISPSYSPSHFSSWGQPAAVFWRKGPAAERALVLVEEFAQRPIEAAALLPR